MSKKQTRRSISVRGATYAALRDDCAARDVSMSDHIEALIAADRAARGLPSVAVQRAFAAVQREGDRQVERIAEKLAPLPSESCIVVGPPPEQTTMLGRAPTPPPKLGHGDGLRPFVHGSARAALAKREQRERAVPVPIAAGAAPGSLKARPAHGDRVPPPDPARGARNVVSF